MNILCLHILLFCFSPYSLSDYWRSCYLTKFVIATFVSILYCQASFRLRREFSLVLYFCVAGLEVTKASSYDLWNIEGQLDETFPVWERWVVCYFKECISRLYLLVPASYAQALKCTRNMNYVTKIRNLFWGKFL